MIAAAAMLISFAPPGSASAYTERTLHSFCNYEEYTCGGAGNYPQSGLLKDPSGNLYGMTNDGGTEWGIVFELVPNGNKYSGHILKTFCKDLPVSCTGGGQPMGDLIMDVDGNLYGTTTRLGKHGGGTIFKLTHAAGRVTYTVIYAFCSKTNCTDGNFPSAGLAYAGQASGTLWDKSSPLFGTTDAGGAKNKGVAYKLVPNGSGWSYQVLHSFNQGTLSSAGPLVLDASGNLYGMTGYGGKYGAGALYRLAAGTWTETTLHNFCAEANCADGNNGSGRLAIDAAGNLFGTTFFGGSGSVCPDTDYGCGVAFERTAGGTYSVIYNFCSLSDCTDGIEPYAGMILDAGGNLLGTTLNGGTGTGNGGTVFKLSPGAVWTETVLYNFCSVQNCKDGDEPGASLIMDAEGDLYGTTFFGGPRDGGTVFELTP